MENVITLRIIEKEERFEILVSYGQGEYETITALSVKGKDFNDQYRIDSVRHRFKEQLAEGTERRSFERMEAVLQDVLTDTMNDLYAKGYKMVSGSSVLSGHKIIHLFVLSKTV
jgi:hypothetical protein